MLMMLVATAAFSQTIENGRRLIYYERWEGAEGIFEQIIKNNPAYLDAYYWLTEVLLEQKKPDVAKKIMQQLDAYLAAHPDQEKTMLNRIGEAQLLLISGDSINAKLIFEELRKKTKEKNPEILIAIATAWMHTKSPDYANILHLLDKAEKRDKRNPFISSLRGDIYRRLNHGGKAVQSYQQALQKNSLFAEADYKIGKIYLTQNNPESFLKHFNDAISRDSAYAPAYYELYYYYYFRDVNKAKLYLDKYIANTDPSIENDYMVTDLLFASSKPIEAIQSASALVQKEGDSAKPRLFKLIAYSYDALGDSVKALQYLNKYFQMEVDSNYVAKDFELKAKLLNTLPGNEEQVIQNLEVAFSKDTVLANKSTYASKLADEFKKTGNKANEAKWLGIAYQLNDHPTNLDLYYWGMAHYSAGEYQKADSVFAIYTEKYPEHIQGYYWRAKSNALLDSTMENGLAIPHYEKVIEMGLADTTKNKSLLIQSYGYIGAYEANVKKDFKLALEKFQKILEFDPGNDDAMKYRDILEKWVKSEVKNSD